MNPSSYPRRKSPRLKDRDYSEDGSYFVTICTSNRDHHFGGIIDGEMQLNAYGHLATACWLLMPRHYKQIQIDLYVVMPNHVHGIVILMQANLPKEKQRNLGQIIGAYKAAVTRQVNQLETSIVGGLWQERFHDHIIRNESDLNRIREYVINNPKVWEKDTFYRPT
jgi:putative transposase